MIILTPYSATAEAEMAKPEQRITRSARELILGDGISTLVFMVVNSVWDELAAMLAVAMGLKMQTTGLMVLISGLMLYCPFSDAVFGTGAWTRAL